MMKLTRLLTVRNFPRVIVLEKRCIHQVETKSQEREVQEVKIPVPWGHIAGKWWGSTNVRPILGLHGWQDNAATWDRLIPLLHPDISVLAIDSPGHGLSSHHPKGQPYRLIDVIQIIRRIVTHYGWDKISLLGHSMGGAQSFIYSSVYPDQVENVIVIDAFKPLSVDIETEIKKIGPELDKFIEVDSRDTDTEPSYPYEEMVDRLYKGMVRNSLTKESCEVLLKRGMKKSGDGYSFTRDVRLKYVHLSGWIHEYILEQASRINCNYLFIKAIPGLVYESPRITSETLEVIKKSAKRFEFQTVEGLHHVHLNNPERVAPIVNQFLKSSGGGPSEILLSALQPQETTSKKFNFL